ncbi:MAG: Gfo/Idh/MocA family oxidoreductase [Bacteroidia bacterium]|nr:Gfo/Idh/MocA family oxidoreductase [Bacteroidia bacterium]
MLKIGVLGAESSVGIKLQALKELKESAIAGIFDNNFKKASELAQIYEINAFDSFKNLLDAVDALYLSEPLPFLYELTVEAIKNSKHLFIGNPMNISVHEALSLLKLSEEAHLKIQVGFPERFNSAYMAARAYFNNPMFIETHRLSMFNAATAEIPVVLELMVHDIDIIVSAIKSNVKKNQRQRGCDN